MKIILTGGTGFTGEWVVRSLMGAGFRPTLLVRPSSRLDFPQSLKLPTITGDLNDSGSLERAFAGHELLVNLASLGFGHAPNLVAAAQRSGIQKAIFFSTTAIFTQLPVASRNLRVSAEEAVRNSGLPWILFQPTMIYGTSKDRNVSRLLRFLTTWRFFPVPAQGKAWQQPVHVADVAAAVVNCVQRPGLENRAYILSGQHPISFREMILEAATALGIRAHIVNFPVAPWHRFAQILEGLRVPLPFRSEQILRLSEDKNFSHDIAGRDLGFRPRSFSQGVREQVAATRLQI